MKIDYEAPRTLMLSKLSAIIADWMEDQGFFRTCLNCEHWHKTNEICSKYNQRPPATIIVSGCPDHSDLIPF